MKAEITKVPNLNTNGVVLTSSSDGTLSVVALPADATKYLDGTGAFTVPAGGGGTPSLTSTQIAYGDGSNLMTSSAELTYVSSTGTMTLTKSSTSPVTFYIDNTEAANTAADSHLRLRTGGAGGGDPHLQFSIAGVQNWTTGIDNSASDIFAISASSQPGTDDRLRLTVAGAMQLPVYGGGSITGTATYNLAVDATGNVIEVATGGGGTPGGSNTDIQYNNAGAFGGYAIPLSSTLGGTGVAQSSAVNTITLGRAFITSGAFDITLTATGTTNVTLPTSGTLATLAGAESLTNKKLGSLTSNGFVKTSGGDGTLSVDTSTYLTAVPTNTNVTTITFIIDGGGSTITTGLKGDLEIPFGCTINAVTMLADQSGSMVIDIWKKAYTLDSPPTVANTITASDKPTLSSHSTYQSTALTGWTTSITAGNTLRFNVDSVTSIQRVTISLKVTKT